MNFDRWLKKTLILVLSGVVIVFGIKYLWTNAVWPLSNILLDAFARGPTDWTYYLSDLGAIGTSILVVAAAVAIPVVLFDRLVIRRRLRRLDELEKRMREAARNHRPGS